MVKNLTAMWKTQVWSLGREDPLEEGTATHSNILAWRIPWTEEPDRLQSMGSCRVGHDWGDSALTHAHTQWTTKVTQLVHIRPEAWTQLLWSVTQCTSFSMTRPLKMWFEFVLMVSGSLTCIPKCAEAALGSQKAFHIGHIPKEHGILLNPSCGTSLCRLCSTHRDQCMNCWCLWLSVCYHEVSATSDVQGSP